MIATRTVPLVVLAFSFLITVQAQAPAWAQCGGHIWNGETSCISGYSCITVTPYYSQCQAGTIREPPVASSPVFTTVPSFTSTTTSSTAAATGSQIRTVQAPVYHFYLQNNGGKPVLGPESSAGRFTIGGTISLNNADGTKLYLNLDNTATTSYKPLTFNATAITTNWGLEGDTIITTNPRQLNFIACSTSSSTFYDLFLQNGNTTPSGRSCSLQTIHLPCLC